MHLLGRLPGFAIDWRHLSVWLSTGEVEDVLAASLRVVALACAYWLLVSTILYVTARVTHLPTLTRAVEWATLPAMRRLTDRAIAVALVGSTVTSGAGVAWASPASPSKAPLIVLGVDEAPPPPGIQPPPPPTLEVPSPQPLDFPSGVDLPPVTALPSHVVPPPLVAPPAPPGILTPPSVQSSQESGPEGHGVLREVTNGDAEATDRPADEVHMVVRGDNLWKIAASTLGRRHGHALEDREIAAYWHLIVEANRDRLRSVDPNLIYPGEEILLPAREGQPGDRGAPAGPVGTRPVAGS